MRKQNYTAKLDKGWKTSWHFTGPLGNAICGRTSGNSTERIDLVDCKLCLNKMLKEGIIDEETYNRNRNIATE